MKPWELMLLNFLKAVSPTVETLFVHNVKSVAIYNASDALFGAVVDHINELNNPAPVTPAAPVVSQAASGN